MEFLASLLSLPVVEFTTETLNASFDSDSSGDLSPVGYHTIIQLTGPRFVGLLLAASKRYFEFCCF